MRFRTLGTAGIVIAIILGVAGAALMTARLYAGLTDAVEAREFQRMQQIVEAALSDAQGRALARAELVADIPQVQSLFAAGDRAGLEAALARMFADQKARHGVAQAQFHVAPATSFLRLNDPEKFGDDLTQFRPMVVAANRDHLPMKGVALARSGPAIFGITPVEDATGKPIGTFEFGVDFGPILANLKNAYGLDLALFIEEKPLLDIAKGVDPERLGDQNRVGRYIRYETTNTEQVSALVGPEDLAVVNEPISYVRDFNGLAEGVLLIPINNVSGTPIGVIAAVSDFSGSRAAVGRSQVWQVVITLITITLLAGVVLVIQRGALTRPLQVLGDRLTRLRAGEPPEPIPGAAKFPAELAPFVEAYQDLSRRNAAS